MKIIKKLDNLVDKFCSNLLVVAVLAMLIFSFFSIILRWFSISFQWIEPFVRHLIFISTFLGGVLATGRGTHIGIDILGKVFESRGNLKAQKIVKRIIFIVSFFSLLWLMKSSYDFMIVELKYGKEVFFGIHSGVLVGITPIGFLLISIRYFTQFFLSFESESREEVSS